MIINCNSCEKKFVVPDQAISQIGRIVQCGSFGNKWRQFQSNNEKKIIRATNENKKNVIKKNKIYKKRSTKKKREIELYSPEYLAKKHGIHLNNINTKDSINNKASKKISFDFFSSFLIFIIFLITALRLTYFFQDTLINLFPVAEIYLNILFENTNNIFQIWKDLIANY